MKKINVPFFLVSLLLQTHILYASARQTPIDDFKSWGFSSKIEYERAIRQATERDPFEGFDVIKAKELGLSLQEYRSALELETKRMIPTCHSSAKTEKTDFELALAIQKEEEKKLLAQQFEKDRLLAQLLQKEELGGKKSFKNLILETNERSREILQSKDKSVLVNFMEIVKYLRSITQGTDVHVLDGYVFGPKGQIQNLATVGALYNIDNPNLKLSDVGQQMIEFVKANPKLFLGYKYEDQSVAAEKIIEIIGMHFSKMDSEVSSICPTSREIWSRAWTLAIRMYKELKDPTPIVTVFDEALEGHLTRGGCIQGRIDRGFVAYTILLGKVGVGIFE